MTNSQASFDRDCTYRMFLKIIGYGCVTMVTTRS
ncbi:hypothetical protein Mpal_0856 [Methanosphaerula palustris E1-9c]|uniref:Uncharacterized protein n=1 Tax=Methanosphaerula palustris (strain ATCC BAA-1556 / DSM 19958 / E1-9c) TaxID=521011 RepID=B8GGG1_METPE|nr:hypothetical protein Mpal_0856 [Methanosphaerula palustris E1-9c]